MASQPPCGRGDRRQPEASEDHSSLLFGLILMETCAIYALLVAILLIFVLGAGA